MSAAAEPPTVPPDSGGTVDRQLEILRAFSSRHAELADVRTELQRVVAEMQASGADETLLKQADALLERIRELQRNKRAWLKEIKPYIRQVFYLTLTVILVPFGLIMVTWGLPATEKADLMVDWGKTVLPAVVGFASAAVGYLFGSGSDDASP